MEAYDCAKNNHSWQKVLSVISQHPDWLIRVPQGRRWTMLHQIVYCGNVAHLNEILACQISNSDFRLLHKALDDKTVLEVATERAHIHTQMLRRIERLVALDKLLNDAKDNKWELVKQFLRQKPDMVNEKPPYRKYYLAHFLALTGQLNIFKELSEICTFKLDLLSDEKTINQLARDYNHIEFAEHVENLQANQPAQTAEANPANVDENSIPPYPTTAAEPFYSPGFYENPGIMIFSINPNTIGNIFFPQDESLTFPSHHHHHTSNDSHFATHSLFHGANSMTMHTASSSTEKKQEAPIPPPLTEEEQAVYEKTILENLNKFSSTSLLSSITCSITKSILHDPVVAADGFTYEREAILNWFQQSNRSPMTNQELDNLELKPNHAIKSLLQSLADTKSTDEKNEK